MCNRAALVEISEKLQAVVIPAKRDEILCEIEFLQDWYSIPKKELPRETMKRMADEWVEDLEKYPMFAIIDACRKYRQDPAKNFPPSTSGALMPYLDSSFHRWRSLSAHASHAIRKIEMGQVEVKREKISQADAIDFVAKLREAQAKKVFK